MVARTGCGALCYRRHPRCVCFLGLGQHALRSAHLSAIYPGEHAAQTMLDGRSNSYHGQVKPGVCCNIRQMHTVCSAVRLPMHIQHYSISCALQAVLLECGLPAPVHWTFAGNTTTHAKRAVTGMCAALGSPCTVLETSARRKESADAALLHAMSSCVQTLAHPKSAAIVLVSADAGVRFLTAP